MRTVFAVGLGLGALAFGPGAHAQSAGANVFGAGVLHAAPQDSSKPLEVTSPAVAAGVIPNTGASVGSVTTLELSYTRFITDNVAAEMTTGVPPRFHLTGEQDLGPLGELGSARMWSPAVLIKYYFGEAESVLRPFIGVGVSYVWYSDITLTPSFQSEMSSRFSQGATTSAPTEVDLENRFAPVLSAGLSYRLNERWSLGASVSYMPLTTRADLRTRVDGATFESSSEFKLNPIIGSVGLLYRF